MGLNVFDFIHTERGLEKTIEGLKQEKANLESFIETELYKSLARKYKKEEYERIIDKYKDIIESRKIKLKKEYEKEIDKKISDLTALYNEMLSLG